MILGALAPLLALLLSGCTSGTARVEIKSYRDPYFPETYDIAFEDCAYRIGNEGGLHVAGHTHDPQPTARGTWLSQYLHVHMYWEPQPGRTFANETACNATIRYLVASDEGIAIYAGTGFAFPERHRDGTLALRVESARLRLDNTTGAMPDFLGHAWLTGELVAKQDAGQAATIAREMERLAGR